MCCGGVDGEEWICLAFYTRLARFAMEVLVVFLAVLGGWLIYTCVLVPYGAAL